MGPYSSKYLASNKKRGPPARVCKSPPNTPLMKEKKLPSYFWMTAFGMAAMPSAGPKPKLVKNWAPKTLMESTSPAGLGPCKADRSNLDGDTKKSNRDGCLTHVPSSRMRKPAKYRRIFSISQSKPRCVEGSVSQLEIKYDSYVDESSNWIFSCRDGIPLPSMRNVRGILVAVGLRVAVFVESTISFFFSNSDDTKRREEGAVVVNRRLVGTKASVVSKWQKQTIRTITRTSEANRGMIVKVDCCCFVLLLFKLQWIELAVVLLATS